MECPRQEYWSELPFSSPEELLDPGIKPVSPALAAKFSTTEPPRKPRKKHGLVLLQVSHLTFHLHFLNHIMYIIKHFFLLGHALLKFNSTHYLTWVTAYIIFPLFIIGFLTFSFFDFSYLSHSLFFFFFLLISRSFHWNTATVKICFLYIFYEMSYLFEQYTMTDFQSLMTCKNGNCIFSTLPQIKWASRSH